MNIIKENNTKVNFIYFKLDIKSDIMYEIQGEGMINECDMAIIRTSSLPDVNNMQQMVEQAKKYLNENFPNGDWYYKLSNKGKHVFWKRQLLLRQRQNQMQIPFNQAA